MSNIIQIKVPDFSGNSDVAVIKEWTVEEHQPVKKGQTIAKVQVVATTKDVVAPYDGIVTKILKTANNSTVSITDVIAEFTPSDDLIPTIEFDQSDTQDTKDSENVDKEKNDQALSNSVSKDLVATEDTEQKLLTSLNDILTEITKTRDSHQHNLKHLYDDYKVKGSSTESLAIKEFDNQLTAITTKIGTIDNLPIDEAERVYNDIVTSINGIDINHFCIEINDELKSDVLVTQLEDTLILDIEVINSRFHKLLEDTQAQDRESSKVKSSIQNIRTELDHSLQLLKFSKNGLSDLQKILLNDIQNRLYEQRAQVKSLLEAAITEKRKEIEQEIKVDEQKKAVNKQETKLEKNIPSKNKPEQLESNESSTDTKSDAKLAHDFSATSIARKNKTKQLENSESSTATEKPDDVEVMDGFDNSNIKQHLRTLAKVDDYLADDPCYAVILGLSGIGKSSGLEMILNTWYQAPVGEHVLDVDQTEAGEFNPISNISDADGNAINLVDVAGEDFLSWLVDNNCKNMINSISERALSRNQLVVSRKYKENKEYFERLLHNSAHVYIMLPAKEANDEVGHYSPAQVARRTATSLANILMTYNKHNKVTFIINHIDGINAIKQQNNQQPYYSHNNKDLIIKLIEKSTGKKDSDGKDISEYDTDAIISHAKIVIKNLCDNNICRELSEKYVAMIHGDTKCNKPLFSAENRQQYKHIDNEGFNFELNKVFSEQTTAGTTFKYKYLALLYPINVFLSRRYQESKDILIDEICSQLSSTERDEFEIKLDSLDIALSQHFEQRNYVASIENLTEVIKEAFAIDELILPKLREDLDAVKQQRTEVQELLDRIQQTIDGSTGENRTNAAIDDNNQFKDFVNVVEQLAGLL